MTGVQTCALPIFLSQFRTKLATDCPGVRKVKFKSEGVQYLQPSLISYAELRAEPPADDSKKVLNTNAISYGADHASACERYFSSALAKRSWWQDDVTISEPFRFEGTVRLSSKNTRLDQMFGNKIIQPIE